MPAGPARAAGAVRGTPLNSRNAGREEIGEFVRLREMHTPAIEKGPETNRLLSSRYRMWVSRAREARIGPNGHFPRVPVDIGYSIS
nr:hypothetical protein JVH1_1563 [Rhodococcus sp. JVH1]